MMLAFALAAGLFQPTTPLRAVGPFETRTVNYAPGESESPGNHGYDVVLVPIDPGMTAELEGVPVAWTPGSPILISRGAPHHIANPTDHQVTFAEIRTVGDNLAGNDATVDASGATIVRSVFGKYVRATVWRIERGGHVEWPAGVEQVVVFRRPYRVALGSGQQRDTEIDVFADQRSFTNQYGDAVEIVRVSRMASR